MRPLSATAWAWLAKVGWGSIAMRPPKTPGEWQRARWHLPHFGGDMGGSGQCGLGIGANWLQHAPMGRFLPLAAVALLLPLSGCCSLSRLFCGPDKSPWVPIDYSTPEATVRVLLEAIRRDEPSVVYESLAGGILLAHEARRRDRSTRLAAPTRRSPGPARRRLCRSATPRADRRPRRHLRTRRRRAQAAH